MTGRSANDGWDSPYWATLYHGVGYARTFAELDEWAKEEQAAADERDRKESERAAKGGQT